MLLNNIHWIHNPHIEPTLLNPTINCLHRAAQFLAAMGHSFLPHRSDDSQTALVWIPEQQALSSQPIPLQTTFRLTLAYATFELIFVDDQDEPIERIPLHGRSQPELITKIQSFTQQLGATPYQFQPITHYNLPSHPIDDGTPFDPPNPKHLQEMATYRTNMSLILDKVRTLFPHTSPIHIWPHHFDSAVLITLEHDKAGEPIKTIGIGLAIPDDLCNAPYLYISHWTQENITTNKPLFKLPDGAHWTQGEGPIALLSIRQIARLKGTAEQKTLISHFLVEGIRASLDRIQASQQWL